MLLFLRHFLFALHRVGLLGHQFDNIHLNVYEKVAKDPMCISMFFRGQEPVLVRDDKFKIIPISIFLAKL